MSASFAVLSSWCKSLGTRRVCITFDSRAQLSLIAFLLFEQTPFSSPFSIVVDVLHAKLDRRGVVASSDKLFKNAYTEACFGVRMPDDEDLHCVQPLAYKFAHDTEQQKCHAIDCHRKQPNVKLKLCDRCRGAKYCSRECQSSDWAADRPGFKGHRGHCNKLVSGGRWHPDTPGAIPAELAARYPGVF